VEQTRSQTSGECLDHLKVLELSSTVAGAYCAKLLADLGAEVIKIELPGTGDEARRRGPFLGDDPHPEKGGLHLYLNTNKLGVTLDVRTEAGKRVFTDLAGWSDVLVEDNAPADMEALGLAYGDLREINDRLVMVSLTAFGQSGPYRDYQAREITCHHAGGEGYLLPIESPYPDREPVKAGGLAPDCVCGLSASLAAMAAAYRARATGVGQHVDVSKQDVLMTLIGVDVTLITYSDQVRTRHPRHLVMPSPVRCQDGYVMITPWPDPVWETFARFMGNTRWAESDEYKGVVDRRERWNEINPVVDEWAMGFDKDSLFNQLQTEGIAAAPVNTAEDLVNSPQLEARGFFSEIDHAEAGRLRYPGAPYKLSGTPHRLRRPAPLLGEHNMLVYRDRLGYDESDLAAMAREGTI
jgi:crotonobetainyl-CoA:carnitine CoA-transferase CaiB-like acyl-CoA transferase